MIHLVDVAMSYPQAGEDRMVVLVPGTISLPTDRRLAVLAARRQGKTTLLQLLARQLRPDQGEIFSAVSLSPVINAGAVMHAQLSAVENIRFLARAYGFDADALLLAVDTLLGPGIAFDQPLKSQDGARRRQCEAALMVALPFQCYLIDEVGLLDADLVTRCLESFADRRAGVVFSTSQPRLVRDYAEAAVIIDDGVLVLFEDVEDAIASYESKRR